MHHEFKNNLENEYNSIFIMTNFIETRQTPGICAEVNDCIYHWISILYMISFRLDQMLNVRKTLTVWKNIHQSAYGMVDMQKVSLLC